MNKGDVVQIIDEDHHWFPALLVVDEVKNWGVTASAFMVERNNVGSAYIRLQEGTYTKIGEAAVFPE